MHQQYNEIESHSQSKPSMRDTIWIIAKTKYLNIATIVFTYETITSEIEVLGMNRQMEYAIHSHPQGHSPHQKIQVTATGLGGGYHIQQEGRQKGKYLTGQLLGMYESETQEQLQHMARGPETRQISKRSLRKAVHYLVL